MSTVPDADRTQPVHTVPHSTLRESPVRENAAEQKRRFGGIRWGAAFFGWVTAMGMAVLLSAVVAAVGAALGLVSLSGTPVDVLDQAAARTVGVAGAIVLLAILFVGYFCGGYVAGRMARFAGAKQGVAVWLWALLFAVIVAIAGAVAGVRFDALASGLPSFPVTVDELTTGSAATAVGALVASLVGAVLGGLAGMRYHRKVDRDLAV
jgi:membrane protease YdiL (CAAX protease family)